MKFNRKHSSFSPVQKRMRGGKQKDARVLQWLCFYLKIHSLQYVDHTKKNSSVIVWNFLQNSKITAEYAKSKWQIIHYDHKTIEIRLK